MGRRHELALLDEALSAARGVVVQALHGLGGIGKSAPAAHWADQRAGQYNPVWWIGAETRADMDAGLAALATALQPDFAGTLSQEALCERAVQWLASDAYRAVGDLEHAFTLCEQTLERCRETLGEDHPETLRAWHDPASCYRTDQQVRRSVELVERTLQQCRESFGDEHPTTLWTQNVLAGAYCAAGDTDRAVELCERTLEVRERVLGHDHPDTLVSRSNLAATYESAGEWERVTGLFARVLEDRARVLGPDHPDTVRSQAILRSARGRTLRVLP
ncbi:tetratricopeptide repeat protein [Streptomyces sp. NPDC058676]|uniref:tetratricopeptide repeat protein n=1 Tax=unclassified Streptomyces TaxID=2593676 RepID=UPI0036467741